jgi:hypothetical protein
LLLRRLIALCRVDLDNARMVKDGNQRGRRLMGEGGGGRPGTGLVAGFAAALAGAVALLSVRAPVVAQGNDSSPVPGGAPVQPRFSIRADRGFIDDPFALAPKTRSLAVLLTDAASFARIDIIDLETGRPRRTVTLGDPQRLFERVLFADDGAGIVLISRDAGSGRRSAQYFDAHGKPSALVGPATDFGLTSRDGEHFLLAVSRQNGAGGEVVNITRHRATGLGRVGKAKAVAISKADELRSPPLKQVSFQDGYAALVGLAPGSYDKARDIRLPDRAAVFDVLAGDFSFRTDVSDVVAWATATELRKKLPGRSLFAVLAPDLKAFDLVDWLGRRAPLELPTPLRYYDPSTLVELEPGRGGLLFSLATDPLHPEALARRKKDPAYLDIYWARAAAAKSGASLDPLRPNLNRLLRAPADDRPTAWLAAGGYAAVLRKHKNFSRGGSLLEIFPLEAALPE